MSSGGQPASYPVDVKSLRLQASTVPPIWVPGLLPPHGIAGFVDGYCALVTTNAWVDGTAYTQEFVDGIALTPPQAVGHATRTGFEVTFHLDNVWLPRAARILDLAGAHEMIIDRRRDTT